MSYPCFFFIVIDYWVRWLLTKGRTVLWQLDECNALGHAHWSDNGNEKDIHTSEIWCCMALTRCFTVSEHLNFLDVLSLGTEMHKFNGSSQKTSYNVLSNRKVVKGFLSIGYSQEMFYLTVNRKHNSAELQSWSLFLNCCLNICGFESQPCIEKWNQSSGWNGIVNENSGINKRAQTVATARICPSSWY